MRRRTLTPSTLLARICDWDLSSYSDGELREAVGLLAQRATEETGEAPLPECFSIVREAIDRRLGAWRLFGQPSLADLTGDDAPVMVETAASVAHQRRFMRDGDILLPASFYAAARRHRGDGSLRFLATDEQLLAGIHLFRGRVVQMDAGEGKTVAIAFAAALHAVLGRRVHVITANDYLADRDALLLEPVYRSLGLGCGAVLGHMERGERRHIYRRSIVYGSMRELGFDYLRDHLTNMPEEGVQQALDVGIVDEADHALIDEAFTPLIISGNPVGGTRSAVRVNGAVAEMIDRQASLAARLAEEQGLRDQSMRGRVRLLATLMLADPDSPALRRHLAAEPREIRQARSLAEDEQTGLSEALYYAVQPDKRYVTLTDRGRDYLEHRLGPVYERPDEAASPYSDQTLRLRKGAGSGVDLGMRRYAVANQVSQALSAHLLLQRDVDYLVDDDEVILIDPHTGRPKPENIYQSGLQQAVEAKEGATVRPESESLAQVSVSGFVSRYANLAGITGTAESAAGEFRRKYGLGVAVVPPVQPSLRATRPPVVYLDREDKLAAVADEVAARHRIGQPVLVGTRTVEQSEELARLLEERAIPHRVLNAVTTHAEAEVVRSAGFIGAVTVATHMAGRGTDILLEPDLDSRIAGHCVAEIERLLTDGAEDTGNVVVNCPSTQQAAVLLEALERGGRFDVARSAGGYVLGVSLRSGRANTGQASLGFGLGLCVIGTEVHDSSRITLQLNGRSGRQGQHGLTQTFLSLEDRLVNTDAEAIQKLRECHTLDSVGRPCYTGPEVSRRVGQFQEAADREGEAQRALMQDYAAELDRQTHLYHQRRQQVINLVDDPDGVREMCREAVEQVASRLAIKHFGREVDEDYPARFDGLREELQRGYGVDCSELYGEDLAVVPRELTRLLVERLAWQEGRAGEQVFPELARLLYLQVSGELWGGHIATLRDLLAVQLLSGRNHKSAVAEYIRRCTDIWGTHWELADEEFVSRLATMPVSGQETPPAPSVAVSSETERLLGLSSP